MGCSVSRYFDSLLLVNYQLGQFWWSNRCVCGTHGAVMVMQRIFVTTEHDFMPFIILRTLVRIDSFGSGHEADPNCSFFKKETWSRLIAWRWVLLVPMNCSTVLWNNINWVKTLNDRKSQLYCHYRVSEEEEACRQHHRYHAPHALESAGKILQTATRAKARTNARTRCLILVSLPKQIWN